MGLGMPQIHTPGSFVRSTVGDLLRAHASSLLEASPETDVMVMVDDPAGFSGFLSPPVDPREDPLVTLYFSYARERHQDIALGLVPEEQIVASRAVEDSTPIVSRCSFADTQPLLAYTQGQPTTTVGACDSCGFPEAALTVARCSVPRLGDVLVASTDCRLCTHQQAAIRRPGRAIPPRGRKLRLRVETPADLARFVVKSDYAFMEIPELGKWCRPAGGPAAALSGCRLPAIWTCSLLQASRGPPRGLWPPWRG